MNSTSPTNTTVPQSRKKEQISFHCTPEFKRDVNVALANKRSTLRREGTLALAEHLGIASPFKAEQEQEPEQPAA